MRGYKNIVKKCIEATQMLYEKLRDFGIDAMKPTLNILVFKHKEQDRISKCLSSKGWSISRTRKGEIRIVIMPHAIQKLNDFVKDLKACL
jgi:glutamate/tyrosine decarboxylase-like PLP-dependent enzyme